MICALVILYNPVVEEVLKNIQSYFTAVEKLIVVDNSDKFNSALQSVFQTESKITYIDNKGNLGIARALNIGCSVAIEEKFSWILTMDQDSYFEQNSLSNLLSGVNLLSTDNSIGIISPFHQTQTVKSKELKEGFKEIKFCMTSGNLLNLSVWQKVGGFKESYFIDYVDHEFCCRIRKWRFKILECECSVLQHRLGEAEKYRLLTGNVTSSNHNYIRRYYITRNRFATIKDYFFFDPVFCLKEAYNSVAEIIKVLLFEKDKTRKLVASFLGLKDFLIGRYGKFTYEF